MICQLKLRGCVLKMQHQPQWFFCLNEYCMFKYVVFTFVIYGKNKMYIVKTPTRFAGLNPPTQLAASSSSPFLNTTIIISVAAPKT